MPPEVKIEDERQLKFIDEIKRSEVLLTGADFLIGPIEDLEFAIEDKLNKKKEVKVIKCVPCGKDFESKRGKKYCNRKCYLTENKIKRVKKY